MSDRPSPRWPWWTWSPVRWCRRRRIGRPLIGMSWTGWALSSWSAVGAPGQPSAAATDASPVYARSSAGGGLRLAVVGYEPLFTAEAGHRLGLSAGARVVHVASGRLDRDGLDRLRESRPDV